MKEKMIVIGLILFLILIIVLVFYIDKKADWNNRPQYLFGQKIQFKFTDKNEFYKLCPDTGRINGKTQNNDYLIKLKCGEQLELTVKQSDIIGVIK